MANSPDHPELQFVQAEGYTRGRPDGPPLWIVWHDMEASEYSARAESTALYFANPSDGRQVSSHYTADDDSVVQCVRLADSAWTVGNQPGNNRGINWELSGFARQTRAEWLDAFGVAMFAKAAPIVAADMLKFGIPNHWCTVDDLVHFRPGLTTHNDLRVAFGGTSHTDPGPAFPRDYVTQVLDAALNGDDDMAFTDDPDANALAWRVDAAAFGLDKVRGDGPAAGQDMWLVQAIKDLQAKLTDPVPVEVDASAVATALAADPEFRAFLVQAAREGANLAEDS